MKHGQILLALASTAELEAIFVRDWPYLDTYKDDVESCLLGGDCSEVENAVAQLNESVVESSLNPHLQPNDDNKPVQPFALIPYCAYQNNLSILGQESLLMDAPICSQFTPIYPSTDGRLCYTAKISDVTTRYGEDNGIFIIIDSMPIGSYANFMPTIENSKFTVFDSKKLKSEGQADVHLPTLAPFRAKADGTLWPQKDDCYGRISCKRRIFQGL